MYFIFVSFKYFFTKLNQNFTHVVKINTNSTENIKTYNIKKRIYILINKIQIKIDF